MARLKGKRYLLAIMLGVAAFLATFFVVYAGFVQWSREQPTQVLGVSVQVLDPGAMKLYTDLQLTNELTSTDVLEFSVPQLQAPLDQFSTSLRPERELWIKNDSTVPLSVFEFCCKNIISSTGSFLGRYDVFLDCCNPVQPAQSKRLRVILRDTNSGIFSDQFSIVIGALGESGDGMASPLSVQEILENVAESGSGP